MAQNIPEEHVGRTTLPTEIRIAAGLMILFGLAEVATGFTHNFIGVVSTTETSIATVLGVILGIFYIAGGLLILTERKWAAITAIVLLCGDVIGRIIMVLAGLYPLNSFAQSFAIVVGTAIALLFTIYIGLNLMYFE